MTTLPVFGSNIIFQDVGYFENSVTSLSLRGQALYSFRLLYKFQVGKLTIVMVTVLEVLFCSCH